MTKFYCEWLMAACAAALMLSHTKSAEASLIIDLRVGNTAAAAIPGNKTVLATSLGQTFTMQVFADVYGTDADGGNDGLQSLYGSLINEASGTISTEVGPMVGAAPFTATHQNGAVFAAGSNTNRGTVDGGVETDYIYERAGMMQLNDAQQALNVHNGDFSTPLPGTLISNSNGVGSEFYLGHAVVTITALGSDTTFNWRPRVAADGGYVTQAALWIEDTGVSVTPAGALVLSLEPSDPFNNTYGVGDPIVIEVPEPASLGLLALGGLLLLFSRRAIMT